MRSERGHDVDALELGVEQPDKLGDDLPRTRVQTRVVRRDEQHTPRAGADNLCGEVAHDRSELGLRQPAFDPVAVDTFAG